MKKIIIFHFFLLLSTISYAQQSEWQTLTSLLQEEATFFTDKGGTLQSPGFDKFTYRKLLINDSIMVSGIFFEDSTKINQNTYVEETFVMQAGKMKIHSAEFVYNYSFHLTNEPKELFLWIEMTKETPMIHQTKTSYFSLATEEKNTAQMEDKSYILLIPIRRKNRARILRAIETYQFKQIRK